MIRVISVVSLNNSSKAILSLLQNGNRFKDSGDLRTWGNWENIGDGRRQDRRLFLLTYILLLFCESSAVSSSRVFLLLQCSQSM